MLIYIPNTTIRYVRSIVPIVLIVLTTTTDSTTNKNRSISFVLISFILTFFNLIIFFLFLIFKSIVFEFFSSAESKTSCSCQGQRNCLHLL